MKDKYKCYIVYDNLVDSATEVGSEFLDVDP